MASLDFFQATNTLNDGELLDPSFYWVFWTLMAFNSLSMTYTRTAHSQYMKLLFRTSLYSRQLYQYTQEDLRLRVTGSILLTISYFNCAAVVLGYLVKGAPKWLPFAILGGIGV